MVCKKMAKLKVAFVFDKDNRGLTGRWFTNNAYRFFMKGLFENESIEACSFPTEQEFDCNQVAKFDVVIFYDIRKSVYKNADRIKGVSISRAPDSHDIDDKWIRIADELSISHCFNHQSIKYAKKFLPNRIAYHQIIFGVTKNLHRNPNFDNRIKDFILLPGISNKSHYYILRYKCFGLPYVDGKTREAGFVNDEFPVLLGKYRAAIAACTVCSVYKYFELPACGCLTFMEVNSENGCDELEFIDGHNAIFINDNNYIDRFKSYLHDVDNPKWKTIAAAGREFALRKYENKIQVQKLVSIMESLV